MKKKIAILAIVIIAVNIGSNSSDKMVIVPKVCWTRARRSTPVNQRDGRRCFSATPETTPFGV